ncbi:MAG: DUF3574 domain-containing protein [Phycisphaerae bacterium]|nr:DUF3574 domain-containing protein [Phycisphaerae bacterium]
MSSNQCAGRRFARSIAPTTKHAALAVPVCLAIAALCLAGCRSPGPVSVAPPPVAAAEPMIRTELYMGLARSGAANVSEADWAAFLAREVTPRFPDGLTVLSAQGQWLQAGTLVREPSRILVILHAGTSESNAAIESIRAAYIRAFSQDAVLRVDDSVLADFR